MPYSKPIFFLLAFACMQCSAAAQKARYTELYKEYDIAIAGYIKNTLHTWSSATEQTRTQNSKTTTLTLHVFSPDMRLLKENSIALGKIQTWNIDFQYEDTCYYANIIYLVDFQKSNVGKSMILKVDQDGNFTDVTSIHGPWKRMLVPDDKNRFFATTRLKNNLYVAVAETAAQKDSMVAGDFINLPGTNIDGSELLEKLIVRKIDVTSRDWIYQVFGSSTHRFHHPLIHVTDTAVTVTAIAEKNTTDNKPTRPLLFLAKLDTNLTDSGTKFVMLKSVAGNKNENYLPFQLLKLKNKTLLLSRGLYQTETVFYPPATRNNGPLLGPRIIRSLVTNSLKITLIADQNNIVSDTIIEKKYGSMEWENFFITTSGSGVDIFCSRNYNGNKNGITHFSINGEGKVEEEDMIVSVLYEYKVNRAKKPAPGILLIPFTRKNKGGLMRLEYTPIQ